MRKKVSIILLVAVLVLTGCGKNTSNTWKPQQVSRDIRPYIERGIEIIDGYLGFDISAEDADVAFEDLQDRLDSLGVTDEDSKYSFTDTMATFMIYQLTYKDSKDRTDLEFRQLRDILAFQIGESVSGRAYPVEKETALFDDVDAPDYLQSFAAPAAESAMFSVFNNKNHISIAFDAVNGVHPSDLGAYINDLVRILYDDCEGTTDIFLSYKYYGQTAFWLNLEVDGSSVTGSLTANIDGNEEPITKFDTTEQLEEALSCGAKLLGKYSIPE